MSKESGYAKVFVMLAMICITATVIVAIVFDGKNLVPETFDDAVRGCTKGSKAKIVIYSGDWDDSITFSCEWVVPGGIVVKHE